MKAPILTDDMLRYAMAAIGTGSPRDAEMFRAFWRCAWEAAATAPEPPEIDYMALIEAAAKIGHAQGTRGCVAFKHGAEWYRAQIGTLAPRALRESEVMGFYMDFDRRIADRSWDSAEYLVKYGQFISEKTVEANTP